MTDGSGIPAVPDAERALLGSVFLDASVVARERDTVTVQDFYLSRHAAVWQTMLELNERGSAVDYVTVLEALDAAGRLATAGGAFVVGELVMAVPTPINASDYARMIARAAAMRRLISAGGRIASLGMKNELEPEAAVAEAERLLAGVVGAGLGTDFVSQRDALVAYQEELIARSSGTRESDYLVPTGLRDLDKVLGGGLGKGDLIVLAARPSMGKSGLGLTICTNAALARGAGIAVFSLEMSTSSLVGRMLSHASGVPLGLINTGRWEGDERERRIGAALGRLADRRIYWNDEADMTVERMRGALRRQRERDPVDLVMIDHAQLLHQDRRSENRVQEMTAITRQLKAVAKELDVAVLLISQLSRAVEQRPNKRPILADLRESGSLEQDADVVLLLYREEYYRPDTERTGIADVTVAKHRNGPTGVVSLSWIPETTGFWGLERYGV